MGILNLRSFNIGMGSNNKANANVDISAGSLVSGVWACGVRWTWTYGPQPQPVFNIITTTTLRIAIVLVLGFGLGFCFYLLFVFVYYILYII